MSLQSIYDMMHKSFEITRHFHRVQHLSVLVILLKSLIRDGDLDSNGFNLKVVSDNNMMGASTPICSSATMVFLQKNKNSKTKVSVLEFFNDWISLAAELGLVAAGDTIRVSNGKIKLKLYGLDYRVMADLKAIPECEDFTNK